MVEDLMRNNLFSQAYQDSLCKQLVAYTKTI